MPHLDGFYFENEQVKWVDTIELTALEECFPVVYEHSFDTIKQWEPIQVNDKFGFLGVMTIIETYYPYRAWFYWE